MSATVADEVAPGPGPRRRAPGAEETERQRWHALAGVVALAVGLGVGELASALLSGARSLVVAVGGVVVDLVPLWLERAVIGLVGTADKPLLLGSILVVTTLVGVGLGRASARRPAVAVAGIALLAVVGVAAELSDPRTGLAAAVAVGLVFALAATASLVALRAALVPRRARAQASDAGRPDDGPTSDPGRPDGGPSYDPGRPDGGLTSDPGRTDGGPSYDRRRFVKTAAGLAFGAAVAGASGQLLAGRRRVETLRAGIRLPRPRWLAPPIPAGASLAVDGISPLLTPNAAFYRIDTALSVPRVDPADWRLDIGGLVERPFSLTYAELMALPQFEADVTIACVSNGVGGDLVGTARWQGVRLRDVLARAGVRRSATQLVGRSVDGFTAGFPVSFAQASDNAMIAVGMNGKPLPIDHGFPARLVVPGLYGYVSATKWLSALELTTWQALEGYWIPRGWSREAPVKTQSRIDVPRSGASVRPGERVIAGVAWAPTRGIERVEVRVDDGPWQAAELAAPVNAETWRQWRLPWDATAGQHSIAVRATDGAGDTQTAALRDVVPNGATGHHTVGVTVA